MITICPDCGARLEDGASCQSIFDDFLVLEFTDPGYGAVHMLTVACYMTQHGRYSDAGLAWIAQQLRAYLEQGVPVQEIRRQAAKETGQAVRQWKVTRQPGERALPKIAWSLTIADVAAHQHDAASYQAWITRWAQATLDEMQPLVDTQ